MGDHHTTVTAPFCQSGRTLQWVTGADYCAAALRILGDEQRVGVTKEKA